MSNVKKSMLFVWQNLTLHVSVTVLYLVQKLSASIKNDSKIFI